MTSTISSTTARGTEGGAATHDGDESEDDRAPPRACALVIIYAPQRGLLEIWAPWFGHRVAAFNVGLHCQLLVQTPPRLLGGPSCMRKGGGCALIMPDGSMRKIIVRCLRLFTHHLCLRIRTFFLPIDCFLSLLYRHTCIHTRTCDCPRVNARALIITGCTCCKVPFDAALSHASSAGLRDVQRLRKLRSILNPFRNPGGDSACPPSELAGELAGAIREVHRV